MLTDVTVRQAKATGKPYTLVDFDGLYLHVSAIGGRAWYFRYAWRGKRSRMTLGNYPTVGLREARALRDTARELLIQGINPYADRKQKQNPVGQIATGQTAGQTVNQAVAIEHTFKSVFQCWRDFKALSLKTGRQSTLSQIDRIFAKDVLPSLAKQSIFELNQSHLLDVLRRIEKRRALTTAEKVRTWFKQMFRYAMVEKGLPSNPALELDIVALPKPPVSHNPFLRMEEMPAFLQALRGYAGSLDTRLGIRLLFLTGVRTGELRSATPDQFDLHRGLWIVPPEAVKQLQTSARKQGKRVQDLPPYIVPLPRQAIAIVEQLIEAARRRPAQRYLLAARDCLKDRISENTLNGALKRMGYQNRLTGHGIRATISTALNEIGYRQEWIEAQLSHSDPNQVRAAYNHAAYVEQRRMMMQAWADRLDRWEAGDVSDLNERSAITAAPPAFTAHDMEIIEKYLKTLTHGQALPAMTVSGAAVISPIPTDVGK